MPVTELSAHECEAIVAASSQRHTLNFGGALALVLAPEPPPPPPPFLGAPFAGLAATVAGAREGSPSGDALRSSRPRVRGPWKKPLARAGDSAAGDAIIRVSDGEWIKGREGCGVPGPRTGIRSFTGCCRSSVDSAASNIPRPISTRRETARIVNRVARGTSRISDIVNWSCGLFRRGWN